MKAVTGISAAAITTIKTAGILQFCHIYNPSAATMYVAYDGDPGITSAALLIANGMPVLPGVWFMLNNDGERDTFHHEIKICAGAGSGHEVRVAGVHL